MGAWGHKPFENDAALDFMFELEDSENPEQTIRTTLESASKATYLETDEGSAVVVAAAYIDRQVNGTTFSTPDDGEPLEVDSFPNRHSDLTLSHLKPLAIEALRRLLREGSELNELWADTGDHGAWLAEIEALIHRLNN